MSWARLDDRFWSHPKVMQAWRAAPRAIGLHVMAITYCAMHETDGVVPAAFVAHLLPEPGELDSTIDALVRAGMWDEDGHENWRIHDYLEFNQSREDARGKREGNAKRQKEWRDRNASRNDPRNATVQVPRPDPTHNTPPIPPKGGRRRDKVDYERMTAEWAESIGVTGPPERVAHTVRSFAPERFKDPHEAITEYRKFIEEHWTPHLQVRPLEETE